MLGLMVIGGALIYLILWISVTAWAYRWAKRRGYSKGRTLGATFAAFFVMWLLVFWDWIPTVAAHKYYCEKEGGFTVYKSLEQWQKENPGVVETLTPYVKVIDKINPLLSVPYQEPHPGAGYHSWFNERIYYDSDLEWDITKPFPVHKWTTYLADSKTNTKLAEFVYFRSGYPNAMTTGGLSGFKFWLAYPDCGGERMENAKRKFDGFLNDVMHLGEKK